MIALEIKEKLLKILASAKPTQYKGIALYLVNEKILKEVLDLELYVRNQDINKGIEKHNHFYDYAKIINPKYPAFKYTLSMKHKKKEIFNPEKVHKALPSEFEIWKNKSRLELQKQIKNQATAITESQALRLKDSLEKEIALSQIIINEVIEDYKNYEVVISTFEQYTYYPSLYYVIESEGESKAKASDTHLRQEVPNLLWYKDNRPYTELRSNDKMSRIIQTFDRHCENIYIKKKES
jgi:hypothetical protein